METGSEDYARIERAIVFLERNFHDQPQLRDVARSVNLSEFHFQRLFRRWAGISPKRLVQFLMLKRAKGLLDHSANLLDATYEAGLSAPSRLHDLFVSAEAVTPGEFRANGSGLRITYGIHSTPFGECLLAVTGRGICALAFAPQRGSAKLIREIKKRWAEAEFVKNERLTRPYVSRIFAPRALRGTRPLTLHLKGTNFQIKVWEALLKVPPGSVVSYRDIAARVGRPSAVRAVGNAVGRNPIAFLIPCHRVIRKSGIIGNYRWGPTRKKAMLAWEAARSSSPHDAGYYAAGTLTRPDE